MTRALGRVVSSACAQTSVRFFKTGPGEYGEHNRFIGVTVPNQRSVARIFSNLPDSEIVTLLKSPIHEYRLTELLILVERYNNGDSMLKKKVVRLYLSQIICVNNWDLVDCSAPYILGQHYLACGGEKNCTHLRRVTLCGRGAWRLLQPTHSYVRVYSDTRMR